MLPHLPQALNPDFHPDFTAKIGSAPACALETEQTVDDSQPVEHHCQLCPTCSHRLTGHRCKLVCTNCGYYLSCADYY
ncbi:MAG TPA: hypothetical protein VL986_14260 [Terracidiphilus sp.]|nr:hypothetical protein [Terracidiphilus sp.]